MVTHDQPPCSKTPSLLPPSEARGRREHTCLGGPWTDWVRYPHSEKHPGVWRASCFPFPKLLPPLASYSSHDSGATAKLPASVLAPPWVLPGQTCQHLVFRNKALRPIQVQPMAIKLTWPGSTFGNQGASEGMLQRHAIQGKKSPFSLSFLICSICRMPSIIA